MNERYQRALEYAQDYMGAGYYSALKQGGADAGIPYGEEMEKFVRWADKELSK